MFAFFSFIFSIFYQTNYMFDPRFGLSIEGLFAAVGNNYVADSNMPESISFTLLRQIHDFFFIYPCHNISFFNFF
jgi:hypothetical protein